MNLCIELLEVVDDALSCKAGLDEVRDKELFGVPNDIQNAMLNGSSNRGGDNGVKIEGGVIVAPQVILKQFLHFDGLQDDVKVKGEGGVIVAEVDKIEDIVFLLEKTFNEGKGILEGGGVEEGGRHCRRVWF